MRYALSLPNTLDARTLAELAHVAEVSGWDAILLEDYIVHWSSKQATTYDPWVALAAIALKTERIRLGTSVTPISRRRPWKLAREAVTLDHLSNGRLTLGVGLGDINDPGFSQCGEVVETRQRAALVDEALEILVGLWSGEPFSYHGRYYNVQELTCQPKPVQQPRIPIWIGASWPNKAPLHRAARWDGIMPYKATQDGSWSDLTPAEIQEMKHIANEQRKGDAPFEIVPGGRSRNPDREQELTYMRTIAEAGATWWGEYINPQACTDLQACIRHIGQGPLRID